MLKYFVKRILLLFVTLFGITVITFLLTRLTPGDPAAMKVSPGGSAGAARSTAGFQDMVERNRINLGLDKPYVLNFRFEDRDYLAKRSLYDYLRPEQLWKDSGSSQLKRISTIAMPHALELYELIGTANFPKPTDSKGNEFKFVDDAEKRKRLQDIYPSISGSAAAGAGKSGEAAHAFWKEWYAGNRQKFEQKSVEDAVRRYLRGELPVDEMRSFGGYAVPALVEALDTPAQAERADAALAALTNFNFRGQERDWSKASDRAIEQWRSWFRRESLRYGDFNALQHGVNVFANTQFGVWFRQILFLDFGNSYRQNVPVMDLMKQRIPVSLLVSGLSILLAYLVAIPTGILSAAKRYTATDKTITVVLFVLYSLPSFWVATMLILSLTGGANSPGIFPSRGLATEGITLETHDLGTVLWDRIKHLVLPVLVMTYGSIAYISRQMRGAMLENIKLDYIRTARAKGLSEFTVVMKHAFRNSLIPILTISAGLLPELIAGSVIVEVIFTIPGMGQLTYDAILNRDYPIINAELFLAAFLTLLGILITDLLYAVVDPRISYE